KPVAATPFTSAAATTARASSPPQAGSPTAATSRAETHPVSPLHAPPARTYVPPRNGAQAKPEGPTDAAAMPCLPAPCRAGATRTAAALLLARLPPEGAPPPPRRTAEAPPRAPRRSRCPRAPSNPPGRERRPDRHRPA